MLRHSLSVSLLSFLFGEPRLNPPALRTMHCFKLMQATVLCSQSLTRKSGHTATPTSQKVSECSETCSTTEENTNTQRLARSSSGIRRAKCSKVGNRNSRGSTKTRNSHSDFDTSYSTERRISTQKKLSIASPKHRRGYFITSQKAGFVASSKTYQANTKRMVRI